MRTGRDVAIAAMLGAEEFGFSTSVLITLGCVMLRHCHLNNCVVGVATQDGDLEKRFSGKPEHVINYFHFVAQELREIMASLGIRRLDDMVGRADLLSLDKGMLPWKAKGLDFSKILYRPRVPQRVATRCITRQDHGIDNILDLSLIEEAKLALDYGAPVKFDMNIKNADRAAGAMLSGRVCGAFGEEGLSDNTIHVKFKGTAGQSFGAFLAKGVTFELEGMANDYVGKGISGGLLLSTRTEMPYSNQRKILYSATPHFTAPYQARRT
jgi:glutamate synthase (NADPH/NADH) large chain